MCFLSECRLTLKCWTQLLTQISIAIVWNILRFIFLQKNKKNIRTIPRTGENFKIAIIIVNIFLIRDDDLNSQPLT